MTKINYALILILLLSSSFVIFSKADEMCKYHIKNSGVEYANKYVGDCKFGIKHIAFNTFPFFLMLFAVAASKRHRKLQVFYSSLIVFAVMGAIIAEATTSIDPYKGGQISFYLIRALTGVAMFIISILALSFFQIKSRLST